MDIEKVQKEFIKYTEKYDLSDVNIKRKQEHSIRVMRISKRIAEGMKLTQEEIDIATLIGLLHDIARFEQYTKYHTFKDAESIDHGDLGAEILKKDIKKYIETDEYDELIQLAVKNHNKYKIQEGLTQKQEMFAKIIRDADKLDNFRVKEKENFENIFPSKYNPETINYEVVSSKVYENFMKHKCIKLGDRETQIDYWVCVIAFIFDLYFDVSLQYIKEKGYVDILVDRIQYKNDITKKQMEDIRKCAKEYVNNRI